MLGKFTQLGCTFAPPHARFNHPSHADPGIMIRGGSLANIRTFRPSHVHDCQRLGCFAQRISARTGPLKVKPRLYILFQRPSFDQSACEGLGALWPPRRFRYKNAGAAHGGIICRHSEIPSDCAWSSRWVRRQSSDRSAGNGFRHFFGAALRMTGRGSSERCNSGAAWRQVRVP